MVRNTLCPEVRLTVGKPDNFAISAVLPAIDDRTAAQGPTALLELADGTMTFLAGGLNVFQLEADPRLPPLLQDGTNLPLTMFLEWIWFDKVYDLGERQPHSFSEITSGDDTPKVRFERMGNQVVVSWDLRNASRCRGAHYRNPIGQHLVEFDEYINCLHAITVTLVAVIQDRAVLLDRFDAWKQWHDGYSLELIEFCRFVRNRDSQTNGLLIHADLQEMSRKEQTHLEDEAVGQEQP